MFIYIVLEEEKNQKQHDFWRCSVIYSCQLGIFKYGSFQQNSSNSSKSKLPKSLKFTAYVSLSENRKFLKLKRISMQKNTNRSEKKYVKKYILFSNFAFEINISTIISPKYGFWSKSNLLNFKPGKHIYHFRIFQGKKVILRSGGL